MKNKTQFIVNSAIVAALYVAITLATSGLSYYGIQFRISEILVLLCYFNPQYCVSLILGCAISNLFSPLGLVDVVIGSVATALAVLPMHKCPNIYLASLLPVISNGIIVAFELLLVYNEPFWLSALTVSFGEFVVVCLVGVALFRLGLAKNRRFMEMIGADTVKCYYN